MNYDFDFDLYGMETFDALMPFVSTLIAVYLVIIAVALLLGVVLHVIRALSLQTIAKRRGIGNAWLSWLPVGQEWIIGSLSDQYKYLTVGKNQSRRKVLLWLNLAAMLIGFVGTGVSAIQAIEGISQMSYTGFTEESAIMVVVPAVISMVVSVVSLVIGITAYVFRQMSMYDLYKSCDSKNAVVFLVFGILFGITEPFFLLACRNKDGGMPPRKPAGAEPVPQEITDGE